MLSDSFRVCTNYVSCFAVFFYFTFCPPCLHTKKHLKALITILNSQLRPQVLHKPIHRKLILLVSDTHTRTYFLFSMLKVKCIPPEITQYYLFCFLAAVLFCSRRLQNKKAPKLWLIESPWPRKQLSHRPVHRKLVRSGRGLVRGQRLSRGGFWLSPCWAVQNHQVTNNTSHFHGHHVLSFLLLLRLSLWWQ